MAEECKISLTIEENELANKYQKKTQKEHVLDRPGMYIGSINMIEENMWILNENGDKIISKNISFIPALLKLFDECIVNARDHYVKKRIDIQNNIENSIPVSYIDISIQNNDTIVIVNNGNGVDILLHPEHNIYIPELIFTNLLSGTNFNQTEKRIWGGMNGLGAKLAFIWSTFASVETIDHVRGLKYYQEFKNNLDEICPPQIAKCKTKPYTKITFRPDYQRMGIESLTPDMIALFKKRVYDIAAITDKSVKVKYNSEVLPVRNFQEYVDMYIGDKNAAPRVYESPHERWEYAIALSPNHEFIQVSFVNGICTAKGGKHVDYILGQIVRKLTEYIEKKKKVHVSPASIKEQLILFLRCDIEDPLFDGQTKDYLNIPVAKFGSKCDVSDKFIEKIAKMGVMDTACSTTELKDNTKHAKQTNGVKTKTIRGIPKLDDANWAGTEKSRDCILILCEGDSAKTGIIAGLSSQDRNTIGVYPLKGKPLNVREITQAKIANNEEITNLKKILGLETGVNYATIEDVFAKLRYGRVIFMTDQDLDGSHIKGLCINLFASEWPSLFHIPGFIGFMNTPILKARKGAQELQFYNNGEYETWKQSQAAQGNWTIKYYKGLGTSTKKEFTEYFRQKKLVGFQHIGHSSDDIIDMAFCKKRANERKSWLKTYDPNSYLDTSQELITYDDFINKDLIHFSMYDNERNIPNLMDGLKISQRKILYSAFKKHLTTEIKVAQFSGYVSEHSCYHHGEDSLNKTIIAMAQNFVGSNNVNLFVPSGQFGSRLVGGSDAASPRYIFTRLENITRYIFPELDDAILQYLSDDGMPIEPKFYAPIIPMILVNGSEGIGTGYRSEILCYSPRDIITYLKNKLRGDGLANLAIQFMPYYEGFTGTIAQISELNTTPRKFAFKGLYRKVRDDVIQVSELPVGTWTDKFKEHLEALLDEGSTIKKDTKKETKKESKKEKKANSPIVKSYESNSTDTRVDFTITFARGKLAELEQQVINQNDYTCNGVEKMLKLCTTKQESNMYLFDEEEKLVRYDRVQEIIDEYFVVRLQYYDERRDYLINALERELVVLTNKVRYIREVLSGTIDLRQKSKQTIVALLQEKKYKMLDGDADYKYLIKMPMDSVCEENIRTLNTQHDTKAHELEVIQNTTIQQMWLTELLQLEEEYARFTQERKICLGTGELAMTSSTAANGGKKVVKKVVRKAAATTTTAK